MRPRFGFSGHQAVIARPAWNLDFAPGGMRAAQVPLYAGAEPLPTTYTFNSTASCGADLLSSLLRRRGQRSTDTRAYPVDGFQPTWRGGGGFPSVRLSLRLQIFSAYGRRGNAVVDATRPASTWAIPFQPLRAGWYGWVLCWTTAELSRLATFNHRAPRTAWTAWSRRSHTAWAVLPRAAPADTGASPRRLDVRGSRSPCASA